MSSNHVTMLGVLHMHMKILNVEQSDFVAANLPEE